MKQINQSTKYFCPDHLFLGDTRLFLPGHEIGVSHFTNGEKWDLSEKILSDMIDIRQ